MQIANRTTLVLCGSIGLYEVEFNLNTEEIDKYKESGIDFLKRLALEVQYEPRKYINRKSNSNQAAGAVETAQCPHR